MNRLRRSSDRAAAHAAQEDASLATRLATPRQRRFAIWTCVALVGVTILLLPLAGLQLGKVQAFLPAYQTAVIGTYLVTAYLMYGHYRATRSAALLHLGAGCLFTAGVLVLQFLSFPGAFTDQGQLVGGGQTTIWLWFFWHAGPAVSVLAFAWSEYHRPGHLTADHAVAMRTTGFVMLTLFAATVVLVTTFQQSLPVLDVGGDFSGITRSGIAPGLQVLLTISLVLLWQASRFRKVLHLWLAITIVALLCDNAITMAGATRLSLGWYVGRLGALFSSSTMMLAYLRDIKRSYERSVATAVRLASDNEKLALQIDEASLDTLTQLPRREFFTESAEALRAATQAQGCGFATLYVDLDGFKAVNDQYGHSRGDAVLVRTADALRSVLRDLDIAGRVGGDEFIVCLAGPSDAILRIATRVSARIVQKIEALGEGVGASVGLSTCGTDLQRAIAEADAAMYQAKKLAKSRANLSANGAQLHLVRQA